MFRITFILILFLTFFSCAQTEHTEEVTADITAAKMEGRKAAGLILGPEWDDSLKLQKALLDAKAKQSQYVINGKPKSAEAFDSAFITTIRTVNPSLAKKIKP